tara:strand:+ start:49459 stop:50193 length:735 start_codon:yes stop_codon:yes gene_type:complete
MHLLYLNGWAASSAMLDELRSKLPPSYDLDVLDDVYQFELTGVVSKIDELIRPDTVLMAWSLGGMLALYYASLNGVKNKPAALILLNSSACFLEKADFFEGVSRADFRRLKSLVADQDTKALLRLFTHLLVEGSQSHKEDRRLLKRVFNAETLPAWATLSLGLDYLESLDLRRKIDSIQLPGLVILGENDALINAASASDLFRKNTSFKVKVIPGMGHFPFGLFTQNLAEVILDYLNSLSEKKC